MPVYLSVIAPQQRKKEEEEEEEKLFFLSFFRPASGVTQRIAIRCDGRTAYKSDPVRCGRAERERGQLKWKKTAVVSNAGEYSAAYVCCVDGDMTLCVSMAITS